MLNTNIDLDELIWNFNARKWESEIREVSLDLLKLAAGRQVDGTFISFPYTLIIELFTFQRMNAYTTHQSEIMTIKI